MADQALLRKDAGAELRVGSAKSAFQPALSGGKRESEWLVSWDFQAASEILLNRSGHVRESQPHRC
jgi:hypothetical protein